MKVGYRGGKLVSGVSLTATANEIILKFAPFQLSSLVRNGADLVIHLIRYLHNLYGDSRVFFQTDLKMPLTPFRVFMTNLQLRSIYPSSTPLDHSAVP